MKIPIIPCFYAFFHRSLKRKMRDEQKLEMSTCNTSTFQKLPPPLSIPSATSSAFGNVITQTEPSPSSTPIPSVPLRTPKSGGSRPNSRPSSLYGEQSGTTFYSSVILSIVQCMSFRMIFTIVIVSIQWSEELHTLD